MADKYNELSTSGWAVVSDKGKVFGSDSDNESGEQSDYVALENDVVHYHHSSSSSKGVEDEVATEEEVDELVSTESSPALAVEPAGDLSKEPSERAHSSEELAGTTMKVDGTGSSDNNAGGRSSPDEVLMVPTLERGMSISDVIEDNVRARLNISRSRSSASTSSASGFVLDEVVNKSRGSHDDEGSDTSGEAVNDVEIEGDVIDGRVEDVMVSKDTSNDKAPEETVSDLDSEFEHLSQEDIPRDDGLLEADREPDMVGTPAEEGVGELDARPQTSEPNATWIPSHTSSDDSDSSKLFNPGRGRKGIRRRFTARRSRHSSASNAAVVEEVAQRETVARCKEFARGKFPYILLLVVALSTGYYIGSTQIISHKQHVEQGKTQRLHALQDELLSCLSSEEINNDQQVNKEIRCHDNAMKQIDFRELNVPFQDVSNGRQVGLGENTINKDIANEEEETEVEDWLGVEDTINKDTANEEEEDWLGEEDTINKDTANDEEEVEDGIEENIENIPVALWENPDEGEHYQEKGNEMESVRGGDWMDIDAAIGKSPHDAGIEMKSVGDWMDVEDAINQNTERDRAPQSGSSEKESIDEGHQIHLQDATIDNNLDENNDEQNPMQNEKLDKITEYEARISELEAHYKEIHELYKEKMQEPTELVQELYEKIIALESQLRTEALETKHKVKSDDASDTFTDLPDDPSDEPTWMNILSFESLKKKLDEAVKKTEPNIWSYYDKTKEAIGVANKATLDAFGKVYDYTKSEEFASNIANTQQKLQETLDTVNDAVSSQWEAVKKSSEGMSAYVRETGKNAKVTLAEKSEQVKQTISTLDLGKKLQELKNFTSADIVNKTKSTLRDLSEKVVQMKKYTQSDEFKSSVEKTKDTILESLDEAVQNTKESVSGFGDTLGDTWSNMKLGFKDIRSKATENWEAVKQKTGFGKKKNRDKKREHKNAQMKNKHNIKVNEMKNKHNKKKKSLAEDIENINELLTGNWRQLYAKHFTMNCRGDQLCIEEQRDDAEILMQELVKYNEWLQRNNYKKDAKKIKIFFNELWPLVNGKEVDDQMLEDLKVSLGDILKSMHQRAKKHREQFVEPSDNQKQKKADVSDDSIPRKDGRKFSGRGFHSDDDWHSKRAKRRAKEREDEEEEKNYDWFTLRGMDRERERQGDEPIDGDWFLRRGKDRGSQRDSEGHSADPNWYFKWTQSRSDMRTELSMWDLYNWFHDWHDHRYLMRH